MCDIDIDLPDRRLRGRWLGESVPSSTDPYAPTLVFLHEGLGCVELWSGFPAALCARTGLRGFAYDRTGYGRSGVWPHPPGPRFLEVESDSVLPQVLDAVGIGGCLLVGPGDGGTIALNFAALQSPMLRGIATIGAHAVTETRTVSSIRQAREAFGATDLRARLRQYHGTNVDGAFWLWNDSWLAPGFEPMDAARLPRVRVPVLALQGEYDEYGTLVQLRRIARGVSGRCETRVMPGCGHGPHLQDEPTVVEAIARFITTLWRGPTSPAARRVGTALLALWSVLAGTGAAAAVQIGVCESAEARQRLQQAAVLVQQLDERGARTRLGAARPDDASCPESVVAGLALEGWVEARRLAAIGGAPSELATINGVLSRLEAMRVGGAPTAITVQLVVYAEAVLRAAVAAAQDERDEMALYLAHAQDVATALSLAGHPIVWPLSLAEAEGELWLEVDRFDRARTAFMRALEGASGGRPLVGLARSLARLDDVAAACTAWRRAAALPLSPAARHEMREQMARLCGER